MELDGWLWSGLVILIVIVASLAGRSDWFDDCGSWFCHDYWSDSSRNVHEDFGTFVAVFAVIIVIGVVWILFAAATGEAQPSVVQAAPIKPKSLLRVSTQNKRAHVAAPHAAQSHATVSRAKTTHAEVKHRSR